MQYSMRTPFVITARSYCCIKARISSQALLLGDQTHLHGCPGNQQHRKTSQEVDSEEKHLSISTSVLLHFSFYKRKEKKKHGRMFLM